MTSLLCGCMIFDECRMFNARIAGAQEGLYHLRIIQQAPLKSLNDSIAFQQSSKLNLKISTALVSLGYYYKDFILYR